MTRYPNGSTTSPPKVSSKYGPRTGGAYSFHYGTDYVGYTNLVAILGGTVTHAGRFNDAAGNAIVIDSVDPKNGKKVTICRFHVKSWNVKKGQQVSEGAVIGTMGSSGNATGPCDHVEIRYWSGNTFTTVDPELWFRERMSGSPAALGNQRVAGPNGVNGRDKPSSAGAKTDFLTPGAVGTFDGWIRGESVEGNPIWFRGAFSGNWYWSGGFTDKSTHDLADLNPPTIGPKQRQAGVNGVNGRTQPSSTAPKTDFLTPGAVGDFDGWIYGEAVEGNKVWFRGAHSGNWFWSGGFTDKGTHDLTDLNPKRDGNRKVGEADSNIRRLPYLSSPAIGAEAGGTVVSMSGYTKAEAVEGNDVWFRRTSDGHWMWSGGFVDKSTEGLELVPTPNPPVPTSPDNPRGLPEYAPVYPGAFKGLKAPLGFNNDGTPALRNTAGGTVVDPIIDRVIIHHTATIIDQLDFFSYRNGRSVCPSYYPRLDGKMFELIRPGQKPATTGPQWNYRSISIETLNETGAPEWRVTDAQLEAIAQLIAWLAEFDGKTLDGVPVSFTIDREHVISHQEALPGTECPGPYLQAALESIVMRAKAIYDEKHPGPEPEPEPEPGPEMVEVPRDVLEQWRDGSLKAAAEIGTYLEG